MNHQQLMCATPHCCYRLQISDWTGIQEHLSDGHQIMLKSKFIDKLYSIIDNREIIKQQIFDEHKKVIQDQVQGWKKLIIQLIEKQIDSLSITYEVELKDLISDVIKDFNIKLNDKLEEFSKSKTVNPATINQLLNIHDQNNPYPKAELNLNLKDLQNKVDNQLRNLENSLNSLIEPQQHTQDNSNQNLHLNEDKVDLQTEEVEERKLWNLILEDNQMKSLFSKEMKGLADSNDVIKKEQQVNKIVKDLEQNELLQQLSIQQDIQSNSLEYQNESGQRKLKGYKQLQEYQQQEQQQQYYQQQYSNQQQEGENQFKQYHTQEQQEQNQQYQQQQQQQQQQKQQQQQQNTLKGYKQQIQSYRKKRQEGETTNYKNSSIFAPPSQLIFSAPRIIQRKKRIAQKISDNHMKRFSESKFYSQELSLAFIQGKLKKSKSTIVSLSCIYQDPTSELFVGVLDYASLQRSDMRNMKYDPPAYMIYMNCDGQLFSNSQIKNSPLILKKLDSFSISYISDEQQIKFEQNGIEESVKLDIQQWNSYRYFIYSKRITVDILQ